MVDIIQMYEANARIDDETTRALAAEAALLAAIGGKASASAVSALDVRVGAVETALPSKVDTSDYEAAISGLDSAKASVTALGAETVRAMAAETEIAGNLATAAADLVDQFEAGIGDERFARTARLSFASPLVVDGGYLLIPAVSYYSARTLIFQPSSPPDSGLNASRFWSVPLASDPGIEARIYYDYALAADNEPPFAITADAPFVSSETEIIVATLRDGHLTAMPGVPLIGSAHGGVAANAVRYGKEMDKAERLLGATSIGNITATPLTALGFARGAFNAETLEPYAGGDLANLAQGERAFARIYSQSSADFAFGSPTIKFYGSNGVEIASEPMTLERVLSARAAAYIWQGATPANATVWRAGIEDPFGQTIGITGHQFASGINAQWIERGDYPAAVTPALSVRKLQAVSTRFRVLREFVGTPTYTRAESRLKASTPDIPVHGLRLVYANFFVQGGGLGEFDGYNPINVTAAVEPEYDPAIAIAATFNGLRQVTLDPGAIVISDPVPGLSIDGQDFWVRTGLTVEAGGRWPQGYYGFSAGEACYESNSLTSQVYATGAMSAPSGGVGAAGGGYGPLAVVGYAEQGQISIVYLGDSIADGEGDTEITVIDGYIARALQDVDGEAMPYIRLSRGADKLYTNTLPFGYRKRAMFEYGTHGLIALGTNDIADGASLATMKNIVLEISTSMRARGLKVIACTVAPRTTSINDWATVEGQTPVSGFEVGGIRDQYNAWIVNYADGLIDHWCDPNELIESPVAPGKWNVNGLPDFATTDGIHPTSYSHLLMAQVLNRLLKTLAA